jgi:hypothetical protein
VTITIENVHKPAQTVATATATLTVDSAPYADVLAAGLRALGETPGSVFGYGLKDEAGDAIDPRTTEPVTGTISVWAWRD